MHEELVDRLKDTLKAYAVRLPLSSCLTIQEAISALTAPHAAELDTFRELVREMIKHDGSEGSNGYHAMKYHDARLAVLDVLKQSSYAPQAPDALTKYVLEQYANQNLDHADFRVGAYTLATTAPQAETCEHKVWLFGLADTDICAACGVGRPWKRKDGTTTPERGGVVDRRKSPYGYTDVVNDGQTKRTSLSPKGRRKDDRARWTVQETPQTWVEWFDANNVDMTLRKLCAELDRRSAVK
jgi:hypothetical protein